MTVAALPHTTAIETGMNAIAADHANPIDEALLVGVDAHRDRAPLGTVAAIVTTMGVDHAVAGVTSAIGIVTVAAPALAILLLTIAAVVAAT